MGNMFHTCSLMGYSLIRNRLKVGTWSLGFVSWRVAFVVTCHWKNGLEGGEGSSEQRTESRFCLKSRFSCEKLEAMRESLATQIIHVLIAQMMEEQISMALELPSFFPITFHFSSSSLSFKDFRQLEYKVQAG